VHGEQREGALEAARGVADRGGEVAGLAVRLGEEVARDLGVGLGEELDAVGEELVAQGREVLDDAVVDDGEAAAVGEVRVGVDVGRAAVGGPPRVADGRGGVGERGGGVSPAGGSGGGPPTAAG
jgi:hypothetical protein